MPRSHAHVVVLSGRPRVTADADREYFLGLLNDKLTHTFGTPLKHLFKEGVVHPYGDFLREVRHVETPSIAPRPQKPRWAETAPPVPTEPAAPPHN